MLRAQRQRPQRPTAAEQAGSVGVPETPLSRLVQAAFEDHPGWTLESVARKAKIPVSTVSAYRTGRISGERAHRDRLSRLALALGLNVEDVLEAAGAASGEPDEQALIKLFRRLPPGPDRAQAVETLRVHVRFARERKRGK